MPARRHRTDEDIGIGGVALHAHAVTEQRAAGEGARRIDGEHADLVPPRARVGYEPLGKGRLPGPRRARDPDRVRAARVGIENLHRRSERVPTVLDERDEAGDREALSGENAFRQRVDVQRFASGPTAMTSVTPGTRSRRIRSTPCFNVTGEIGPALARPKSCTVTTPPRPPRADVAASIWMAGRMSSRASLI